MALPCDQPQKLAREQYAEVRGTDAYREGCRLRQQRYLERLHAAMTPAERRAWQDDKNAAVERWNATPAGQAWQLEANRRRRALELEAAGDYGTDRQPTVLRELEGDWHWQAILAEYGDRCVYCGGRPWGPSLTLDHDLALTRGGKNDRAKIAPACKACNSAKRNRVDGFGFVLERLPLLFDKAAERVAAKSSSPARGLAWKPAAAVTRSQNTSSGRRRVASCPAAAAGGTRIRGASRYNANATASRSSTAPITNDTSTRAANPTPATNPRPITNTTPRA